MADENPHIPQRQAQRHGPGGKEDTWLNRYYKRIKTPFGMRKGNKGTRHAFGEAGMGQCIMDKAKPEGTSLFSTWTPSRHGDEQNRLYSEKTLLL